MPFKIETVKWKWADAVKQKNVYRDEEFIITNSKEEALESIDFLLNKPQGITGAITVERDGKYYTYYRYNMPCIGYLAKYRDSHGEKFSLNPYFPRDIRVAFPEGNIIFIGIYRQNIKKDIEQPYYQFILSKESPWVSAFGKKETIIFKDNYFILTNMETGDPTVFYSLMRLGGLMNGYGGATKKDWNPKADILLSKCNSGADPRRICGAKPIKTSGGTWGKNFGYTRPFCEYIFIEKLPRKLEDFSKLSTTNYPASPQVSNEYFKNTMKEKFGVDINKHDENLHQALIKSWSFFKKESKKLGDGFPAEKIDDEGKNK